MTKKLQIYKCEVCGNVVEVLHEGVGQLVCCGKPMNLMAENTVDASVEKHIPVVEKTGSGNFNVRVGSVLHPKEEKHYIEWVEVLSAGEASKKFLNPGDVPEVSFSFNGAKVLARAYCNIHGLWKSGEGK